MSTHNRHYRHLSEPDIALCLEWLYDNRQQLTSIQYDIPVGNGTDPGATAEPALRAMWKGLTQRRIDAVADTSDFTWLIEICDSATYRSIGQLEVYRQLYLETYQQSKPLKTLILCRAAAPEETAAILAAGHELAVYPPAPEKAPDDPPDRFA
jgi:hypothetical protein